MVTRRQRPQEGYNLVFLIVLFSLLSVMLAAVLPSLSKQIQREKEAELIFRGLQYAEGIRIFQQRFGRYPNTLEELIELEPRCLRQLWKDPMTDDGRWAYVLASGGGGQSGDEDGQGRVLAQGSAPAASFRLGRGDRDKERPAGPILGVVSRAEGTASRTFMGKGRYQEWRFTANILPKPRIVPGTEIVVRGSVELIGKPFPRGLQPRGLSPDGAQNLAGGDTPGDLFDDEEGDG
ncbi:MAG: type II secretion system protein [Acidobacteria bacterium]|nr:type II secretion system protein [Acidobacteriota bacterium]